MKAGTAGRSFDVKVTAHRRIRREQALELWPIAEYIDFNLIREFGNLIGLRRWGNRNDDSAHLPCSIVSDDRFGTAEKHQADPVAGSHACFAQANGKRVDRRSQIMVCETPISLDDRNFI